MKATGISPWLSPLAHLYGVGVHLRNWLYDKEILSSKSYPIPTICVGNLAVGGTGKTPMVEYLLEMLQSEYRVAVVSRGYKRKTKGLIHATNHSTAQEIGDEPKQILEKYPSTTLVIDGNRRRAIEYILSLPQESRPHVILLDDGYQHRQLKASLYLLLTDYEHPFTEDRLLPAGRLREPTKGRLRADAVIVTRCPQDMQPITRRIMERQLSLYPHQAVFFSSILYGDFVPLYPSDQREPPPSMWPSRNSRILAVAGIARPEQFFSELKGRFKEVVECRFHDHHAFSQSDIDKMESRLHTTSDYLVLTEKDAVRLKDSTLALSETLRKRIFYLPIHPLFLGSGAERLKQLIHTTIQKYPSR